eukprot:456017_1
MCINIMSLKNPVEHLLLIGVDGFGGAYLSNATHFLPTLNHLISNGSYTFRARNAQPTDSAPNWISILTGLRPIESGVSSNLYQYPGDLTPSSVQGISPVSYNYSSNLTLPPLPTMFDILKTYDRNLTTAVIHNWEWFNDLFASNQNIDLEYFTNNSCDDTVGVDQMIHFINDYQPNVMFAHLNSVDAYGHSTFWGSDAYYNATKRVDELIQTLIDALETNDMMSKTQVIVIADHGGYRDTHGQFNAANIFVPIVFYGYCINEGHDVTDLFVQTTDVVPMVLDSFGFNVKQLRYLKGNVYDAIYDIDCLRALPLQNEAPIVLRGYVTLVVVIVFGIYHVLCLGYIIIWRQKKIKATQQMGNLNVTFRRQVDVDEEMDNLNDVEESATNVLLQ